MLCDSDPAILRNSKKYSEDKIYKLIEKLTSIKKMRFAFYQSFNNEENNTSLTDGSVNKKAKTIQNKPHSFINSYNRNYPSKNISSNSQIKDYTFYKKTNLLNIHQKTKSFGKNGMESSAWTTTVFSQR